MRIITLFTIFAALLAGGCSSDPASPKPVAPTLAANDTPSNTMLRFVGAYEQKDETAYAGLFAGDYTYEFSTSTDPTLVQQYSTGWFKQDETISALHLFRGYTPPGGATLPAATTIHITLGSTSPADDNSSGVDPQTHKVLATRIDGSVTVPQSGAEPLTYVIKNNQNVFYLIRGDVAVGLDSTQPADAGHWYIYRWVDQSLAYLPAPNSIHSEPQAAETPTWGRLKAAYR